MKHSGDVDASSWLASCQVRVPVSLSRISAREHFVMNSYNNSGGVLTKLTVVVTALTLITLLLDLPHKLASAYRGFVPSAPQLSVIAMPMHQGIISASGIFSGSAGKWDTLS